MNKNLQHFFHMNGNHRFAHIRQEIQDFFTRMSHLIPSSHHEGTSQDRPPLIPAVDIYETDKDLVIKAEVPGLSEDDIKLSLANSTLTIEAEKKSKREKEGRTYHVIEQSSGLFIRTLSLPMEVDSSKVEAYVKHGILKISLPKSAQSQRIKKDIKVKKG